MKAKNSAASIRARLKRHADRQRQDFDLTLTRFGLERLLYRLSISRHSGSFMLKGALLFMLWYDTRGLGSARPTRDLDLLGFGSDDTDSLAEVFRELCDIEVNDGLVFERTSVKAQEIRKDAGYGGVRVHLVARLDGARITLQVDTGFGDVVTPAPETLLYPVLLEDLPAPRLRVYPKATAIAEKFQALCVLGMPNSRLKDYFDLWILLREGLDAAELCSAINTTFARRNTPLPGDIPAGLSDDFAHAKQVQWRAFIARNKLDAAELTDVVAELRETFRRLGVIDFNARGRIL